MPANGQIPLMLIHGAWLSARSWENFADYFGDARLRRLGARVAAQGRRRRGAARDGRRAPPGLGVNEIVDHYEALIRSARPSRRC